MNSITGSIEEYVRGQLSASGQSFAVVGMSQSALAAWNGTRSKKEEQMKKSDILRSEIAELKGEALAIDARSPGGKFNEADSTRFFQITATTKDFGVAGEIERKQEALENELAKEESDRQRCLARLQDIDLTTNVNPFDRAAGREVTNARVVSPRLTAFSGESAHRDAFDFALTLKAFNGDHASREKLAQRRGPNWLATLNETTPTDGGYLVAPEIVKQLTVYREQVGVSRKLARVFRMQSDNLSFAKQSSGATVYYVGEETAITDSSEQFSTVTLQPRKKACLTYVSSELDADAMVSIVDVAMQDLAHQLALQEDKEFILGDGTSSFGGQTGVKAALTDATASLVSAATNLDTWPELTYADLAKAMANIPDKYAGMPMAWLCSAAFKYQVFDRLTLAQGGASADSMTVNGATMFAGHPIVVSDRMPTTTAAATLCAIFGAFGNAVAIGDRGGIKLAISPHVAFATDRLALRATVRTHVVCHEVGDTVNAGALVGFKTAA